MCLFLLEKRPEEQAVVVIALTGTVAGRILVQTHDLVLQHLVLTQQRLQVLSKLHRSQLGRVRCDAQREHARNDPVHVPHFLGCLFPKAVRRFGQPPGRDQPRLGAVLLNRTELETQRPTEISENTLIGKSLHHHDISAS